MAGPGWACAWAARMASIQTARHVDRCGGRGHGQQMEMVIVQSREQCAPRTLDLHVRSGTHASRRQARWRPR